MKKRILGVALAVVMVFCLAGFGNKIQDKSDKDSRSMFVCVETTSTWKIVYHNETKVMYAVSDSPHNSGTFTLLIDAYGKPMLWESKD